MILVVDHRDSFTHNIAQALAALGADVEVARPDGLTVAGVIARDPAGVVLGPGPGGPERAALALALTLAAPPALPVLGICLGHQVLAVAHGARVVRAPRPVHGHAHAIEHDGQGLFAGLPSPLTVGRYHSLTVDEASLPPTLAVTARSADGCVMGLRHRERAQQGLQFHPDSILSERGAALFARWLEDTAP